MNLKHIIFTGAAAALLTLSSGGVSMAQEPGCLLPEYVDVHLHAVSWEPHPDAAYTRVGWIYVELARSYHDAGEDWEDFFTYRTVANHEGLMYFQPPLQHLASRATYAFILAHPDDRWGAPDCWTEWHFSQPYHPVPVARVEPGNTTLHLDAGPYTFASLLPVEGREDLTWTLRDADGEIVAQSGDFTYGVGLRWRDDYDEIVVPETGEYTLSLQGDEYALVLVYRGHG